MNPTNTGSVPPRASRLRVALHALGGTLLLALTSVSPTYSAPMMRGVTSLPATALGRSTGGHLVINGRMLPSTAHRFELGGTVVGSDTTWDLRIDGESTVGALHRATSGLGALIDSLRDAVAARVDSLRQVRRGMSAIDVLDAFVAEFRSQPRLVRSARRVSDVSFEVCWQGDDDCNEYGVTGGSRVVPAATIRRMLMDDARLIQFCLAHGRVVTISPGGFVIPRLEHAREYLDQYSGSHSR